MSGGSRTVEKREASEAAALHSPSLLDGSTVVLGGIGSDGLRPVGNERAHYLVLIAGGEPGRRVRLGADALLIGRAPPAGLILADAKVSRTHCRVEVAQDEVIVTDLGSTNGTFIDGKQVFGSMPLPTGARLQLGAHVLEHEWRSREDVEGSQELDREIADASRYIQALLPPPLVEGPVRTEWLLRPCTQLGGDAFGYRFIDDRTFIVYLIDVCGHGAGAAMHAVSVMNVLRQGALPGTDFRDPGAVLCSLNQMFQMDAHGGMYVSLWYGAYDLVTRRLAYGSAGHHPGFLVPAGRHRTLPLKTANVVIGATPTYAFKSDTAEVPAGSALYLFSDGVFEITTASGLQWGLDAFLPSLLEPADPGTSEPERLLGAVQRHAGTRSLDDDFSMVVVTFP